MTPVLANQVKSTRDAVVPNAAGLIEIIVDGCVWLKAIDCFWLLSAIYKQPFERGSLPLSGLIETINPCLVTC